jgi:hypothetical protein
VIYVSIEKFLKLVDRTRLFCWFNYGSDNTALLPLLLLKIRSVRMLESIACSEPLFLVVLSSLGSHYTNSGRWIHLPFRGH